MVTEPAIRLHIREALPSDVEAIREVAWAANQEFRHAMGETLFAGYLANVLDVEARAELGSVLVADRDGEVVGTITLYADVHDEGMPVRFPPGRRACARRP